MTRSKAVEWTLRKGDVFGLVVLRAGARVVGVTDTMGNRYGQGSPTAWYTTACADAEPGTNVVTVEYDGPAGRFHIFGPNDAD